MIYLTARKDTKKKRTNEKTFSFVLLNKPSIPPIGGCTKSTNKLLLQNNFIKMETEKTTENKRFGERVVVLRHQLGITQEQLSFRSEVNRTYMGAVERGEKNPSLHTIIKIAKGLNISLKELFDY